MMMPSSLVASLSPAHTLVFDLDDTLYPEREYVLSGFRAVDRWLQLERGIHGFFSNAMRLFSAGRRGKIFDEVLTFLEIPDVALLVPHLVQVYRNHDPHLTLPGESVKILDWARPLFRLGLVSDGFLEVQRRKLAALRLEQWMDFIVFSDQWGRHAWKPSEKPFLELMAHLPGPVAGYVYVADNPSKDFIAPRRLGWRTIRLRTPNGEHALKEPGLGEAADVEIGALTELRAMLVPAGQA